MPRHHAGTELVRDIVAGAESSSPDDLVAVGPTLFFTATDASGNAASCTTAVTVEDTTPPTITVELNRDALWLSIPFAAASLLTALVAVITAINHSPPLPQDQDDIALGALQAALHRGQSIPVAVNVGQDQVAHATSASRPSIVTTTSDGGSLPRSGRWMVASP